MNNILFHESASSSHYDKEARHYDLFNEHSSEIINRQLEILFKDHNVNSVLDLTCGTGSQVFWLQKYGFDKIVGVDISPKMLEIANNKAAKMQLELEFIEGDMRTKSLDKQFDAVITIFNSIGHLTKEDFEKTICNVNSNLCIGGLYVFDIFNLNYLMHADNITKLTIDWMKRDKDLIAREIQYSTINSDGILASYDIYHEQKGDDAPKYVGSAYISIIHIAVRQIVLKSCMKFFAYGGTHIMGILCIYLVKYATALRVALLLLPHFVLRFNPSIR